MQGHDQEVLEELPLVELLIQGALSGVSAVVVDLSLAGVAKYGLDRCQTLAMSWETGSETQSSYTMKI